jgi:tetratricopeptide (TPR) repeat protein
LAAIKPFDRSSMELKELKILLNNPQKLKIVVEELRLKPNLKEEVKGFIVLYDAFHGDCNRILVYLEETNSRFKIKQPRFSNSYLKFAAGFLLIIGIGSLFYLNKTETQKIKRLEISKSDVFIEPGIPTFLDENKTLAWENLMFAIKKESSKKAIQEWKKIEKVAPDNDTVLYFGGIVYSNDNQFDKAIQYFDKNLTKNSTYNDRAAYFIAICFWKKKQIKKAKEIFITLENSKDLNIQSAVREHLKLREFNN